ncbi:MAG: hypothetical protein JXB25_00870 [Deltaproteobacteria bacterium]|nr:hypothetical protein [Deltaproteobacteria bacterium]
MKAPFPFCDATLASLLARHSLRDFDALWNLPAEPVEPPNHRRGGWSGVWHLRLADGEGATHHYYLKRQQNHLSRRGLLLGKKPTFYREYANILRCRVRKLPCLDVAYYDERRRLRREGGRKLPAYQAILITPALEGYTPFSDVLSGWAAMPEELRLQYLQGIARLAADLHRSRLSHNNFYPKHLFVAFDKNPPVRIIDLERMGFQWRRIHGCVLDLETFVRRTGVLSDAEVDYFLFQYLRNHELGQNFSQLKKRLERRHKKRGMDPPTVQS